MDRSVIDMGQRVITGKVAFSLPKKAVQSSSVAIVRFRPEKYVHYRVFDEVIEALAAGLREHGMKTDVVFNRIDPERAVNILIGAHILTDSSLASLPENAIIYNLEQISGAPGDPCSYRPAYSDALLSRRSWDYSLKNIARLTDGSTNHHIEFVPIGYASCLSRLKKTDQDIDVLFYGSLNPRRRRIIDALKEQGYNVHAVFGVYGEERDRLIERAKLVVNIHFYDSYILEAVRVSYLMANSKAVVSECNSGTEVYPHLKDGLCLVPYEQIADACAALLADREKREALEQRALRAVQQLAYADIIKGTGLFPATVRS